MDVQLAHKPYKPNLTPSLPVMHLNLMAAQFRKALQLGRHSDSVDSTVSSQPEGPGFN